MEQNLDPWAKLAKENHNRRYEVKGQVEIGDDGYLEVCLMTAKGDEQVIHLHRYAGKTDNSVAWDCWVFEDGGKSRRHLFMTEKSGK